MQNKKLFILAAVIAVIAIFVISSKNKNHGQHESDEGGHGAAATEFERGPHRGRLLRDDDFSLEITIFEDGVPPQFHLYTYEDDKSIDPKEVKVTIELSRLDGEVNRFEFIPKGDFLDGGATVVEPHSFDVKVEAEYKGNTHQWSYNSYEGRTSITPEAAEAAGIKTEVAGPAVIHEKIALSGRIVLDPNRSAQVKARFSGVVREMRKNLGDSVKAGDVLATVESNDSLQVYPVTSPINGIVLARNSNVGDVASDAPLYQVADLSTVWAELHIFPRDLSRVKAGQTIHIKGMEGDVEAETALTAVPPIAQTTSQTVLARAVLDNSEGKWRSGMAIQGDLVVNEREVPLAVKTTGLQRFRDFTVVFADVNSTYEVRMLELGASDGEMVEVLGGLKPGTHYVSENSFLIKADIEKSGTSHDH